MTGPFYRLCDFTLKFGRSTGNTAGKNLTLLVNEFHKKVGVLIIDILYTALLETAVFLLLNVNRYGS